jgi:hypothetical protein
MLSDSTPADIEDRIQQVSAVVRDRTHDEISVALHDNDYDPQRAAASLLDEDQEKAAGEWTTTSRKSKKKPEVEQSISEPSASAKKRGDRGRQSSSRKGLRQGPKKVVESFGGEDVVVIEHQGRTRSSRGKPRGKTERGRGSRGRGLGRRGTAHLGYRGGKRDGLYHPLSSEKLEETFSSSPSDLVSTQVQPVSEEAWDSEDGNPIPVSSVLPSQTALSSLTSPPTTHSIVGPQEENSSWEEIALTSQHTAEIPEEISSSVAEVNSSSDCTPSTRPRVQFSGVEDTVEKKTKLKSRKSAKSNIPLDAVEMPSNTVEGLEIQFGNLGIGFGESTGESPSSRLETEESTPVIKEDKMAAIVTESSTKSPPAEKDEFPRSLNVSGTATTSSGFLGPDSQNLPAKIDPPPGLSRQVPPQGLPMPSSLPQSRGFQVASTASSHHTSTHHTSTHHTSTHHTSTVSTQSPQINSKLQDTISKPVVTGSSVQLTTLPNVVNSRSLSSSSQVQATKPSAPVANQQPVMYPTVMHHPYMMAPHPMQYYDNMYYHHVSSADYSNISRDSLVSFGDSKAVGSPSTVAQQQGGGMQQGQPHPVPIPYPPYYGMYMGMPYSQQMGPKPASGGGFPSGSGTNFPPSTTAFAAYEEDYRFPTTTSVKSGGVSQDGFKHQYDGKGSSGGAGFGYSMPMGQSGGYGYMHLPYQTMMPLPQEGGAGTGRQTQAPKHSRNYTGNSWGQASHTT